MSIRRLLCAHNDVIDWDVDELDEETDEALGDKIKIQTMVSQSAIITMMPKPMAVAMAILENSFLSGFVHLRDSIVKPEIQYHKIGGTLKISLTVRALPLDQPNGILAELLQWFQMLLDLIHGSFGIL